MFEFSRVPIWKEEAEGLRRRQSLLQRLWSKLDKRREMDYMGELVDHYRVSVERCFTLKDFNEEIPIFFIDMGGSILILGGQWLYDSHTLRAPYELFDRWETEREFFAKFTLRFFPKERIAFELRVEEPFFIEAERIEQELRFNRLQECEVIPGSGDTLLRDLARAGIIEPT